MSLVLGLGWAVTVFSARPHPQEFGIFRHTTSTEGALAGLLPPPRSARQPALAPAYIRESTTASQRQQQQPLQQLVRQDHGPQIGGEPGLATQLQTVLCLDETPDNQVAPPCRGGGGLPRVRTDRPADILSGSLSAVLGSSSGATSTRCVSSFTRLAVDVIRVQGL